FGLALEPLGLALQLVDEEHPVASSTQASPDLGTQFHEARILSLFLGKSGVTRRTFISRKRVGRKDAASYKFAAMRSNRWWALWMLNGFPPPPSLMNSSSSFLAFSLSPLSA